MDGENIPDEEITAAVAVGASVIEHWSTLYPASLWSGLAGCGGVLSCYRAIPGTIIMGYPAPFSNFKLGG